VITGVAATPVGVDARLDRVVVDELGDAAVQAVGAVVVEFDAGTATPRERRMPGY